MVEKRELLLVEDDAVTRELLTLLLQGEGWTVHAEGAGETALEWLAQRLADGAGRPEVVLCDQRLPGMCGPPLAHALRRILTPSHGSGRTVLLAMSATVYAPSVEGYEDFLSKPFSVRDVEKLWREALLRGDEAPVDSPAPPPNLARSGGVGAMSGDGVLPNEVEEAPVLDEAVFAKLQGSMGSPALQSLYRFALADASDRLRHMDEALQAGDAKTYIAEAHALKGSSGMIGARRLQALASAAETAGLFPGSRQSGGNPVGIEPAEETTVMQSKRICDAIANLRLMLETLFPL